MKKRPSQDFEMEHSSHQHQQKETGEAEMATGFPRDVVITESGTLLGPTPACVIPERTKQHDLDTQ